MKIRSQLLLAYLLPLVVVTVGMLLILDRVAVRDLSRTQTEIAVRAVNEVSTANDAVAQRFLTSYGERIVALKAEAAANQLALLLRRRNLSDYKKLRNDPAVRAAAIQDVYAGEGIGGYTSLLDRKGMAVIHPNKENVEGRNYGEYKDVYPETWNLVKRSFTEPRVAGYYRFFDRTSNRIRDKYLVIVWVPGTPFTLDAVVFIDDYFKPVKKVMLAAENRQVGIVQDKIRRASEILVKKVKRWSLLLVCGLALFGALSAFTIARALSLPIIRLRDAVRSVGEGDFAVKVPAGGPAETAELAGAFNKLGLKLSGYVSRLREETAARQAMESELAIARQIQFSLLPRVFPPFPERGEFALHAVIRSARDVAGDFYDFFLAGPDTLVLLVGDVSGKGVPAALFMSMTRTMLRCALQRTCEPGHVLRQVNNVLSEGNEAGMFVTVFLAVYQIRDGVIAYGNAGHHQAWYARPDGSARTFGLLNDPALGMKKEWRYHSGLSKMAPGETLLLFTDGLTEAHSPDGKQLFGEDGLRRFLLENPGIGPARLCESLADAAAAFQNNNLFDDLTLVALQRQKTP